MACIWYGVQSWIGGTCVYLMIRSIWAKFEDLPNSMAASSGTNTRDFLSFFLFWLFSLPAIWFPVHQIRHLFTVKSYVVPIAYVSPLIQSFGTLLTFVTADSPSLAGAYKERVELAPSSTSPQKSMVLSLPGRSSAASCLPSPTSQL